MSETPDTRLIVIVGPTAAGKTAAAVALAARIGGEVINADSMQVYRGMDIGTAKPDAQERAEIPFHLLDIADPDTPYNAAKWKAGAETALAEIAQRGRRAVVCGGTGMYVRALLDGWTLAETPQNPAVRDALSRELEIVGAAEMHRRLAEIDPESAVRLHPNDGFRIVRALEVFQITGQTISAFQQRDRETRQVRPAVRIGLDLPRPLLYERIETRTAQMMAAGLENEVRGLLAQGYAPTLKPLQSLGYKEIITYLSGEITLQTAVETIKMNTRRYAKRQQTWFRADPLIRWLDVSGLNAAEIAERI